jgi:hypothetical protein
MKPALVRPVCYRTRRTLAQRLRPILASLLVALAAALLAIGAASLIARLQVTQAQLDAAHLQGMTVGQAMCGSL